MKKVFISFLAFILLFAGMKASATDFSPAEESGITMYGFCLGTRTGLSVQRGAITFNSSDPTSMTNIDRDEYSYLLAGDYFDGEWYVLTYDKTEEALLPDALVTVDMETGERTHIADITQDIIMWDMSYNYVSKAMYGVAIDAEAGTTSLYTIDLSTADIDEVGVIEGNTEYYVTLACDRSGEMYSIGYDGNLYQLNITQAEEGNTVDASLVGSLGLDSYYAPVYYQSMTFDPATDILYWGSGCDGGYYEFHTIDLRTGKANHIGRLGPDGSQGIQMTNLITPYQDLNPKAHSGFDQAWAESGESGELTVDIIYQPNGHTIDGEPYESFVYPIGTLYIYRDDFSAEPVHIQANQMSMFGVWTDENVSAGWHRYKMIIVNDEVGPGVPRYLRVYVGEDIPDVVTNINLSYNEESNKLRLEWEAPLTGVNGGWLDLENLNYSIVRYPGGTEVASGYTSAVWEEDAGYETGYYYVVKAISSVGEGEGTASNLLIAGMPYQLPWNEDFEAEEADNSWQRSVGSGGYNWSRSTMNGVASSASMEHIINIGASRWMFSPKMVMEAGKTYRVSWYDKSSSTNSYDVTVGKEKTPEEHTQVLKTVATDNSYHIEREAWFTVPENGNYSLGWNCTSDEYSYSFAIDNILLEEAFDIDLAAAYIQGTPAPVQGKENSYRVTVKNNGLQSVGNFAVSLVDENSAVLAATTYQGTLEQGASGVVELAWTPAEVNSPIIKGVVTASGDGRSANNQSKEISTRIQPSTAEIIPVISSEMTSFLMPFNIAVGNSCTQALYFEDEIIRKGEIEAIEYTNNFVSTYVYGRHVKIYMSIVDMEQMAGWTVPDEEADLYFDGAVDFPQGKNTITILLDKPFDYTGGILLITTMHQQAESNSFSDSFGISNSAGRPNRTYVTLSNFPFDWNAPGMPTAMTPNVNLVMKPKKGDNITSPEIVTSLAAYPNPTRGEVNLRNYSEKDGSIKLYDLAGKLVFETTKPRFDINHLNSGIYLLKVAGETVKLIKE